MQIISSPKEMQIIAQDIRAQGKRIVFVPTMGALHEGHLTLLREGRKFGDILVLSIFVNPTQFGANEDLSKYPRDENGDLEKAKSCGVDIVFYPNNDSMYPMGYQNYVEVGSVARGLCGASRPTHFRGVATIVLKLINIVQPNAIIFGEKDYQQLLVIRTMVRDLNIPVEVVGINIVREADGLAMSSRNVYLSKEERSAAVLLSKGIFSAREAFINGETNTEKLISTARAVIESSPLTKIDYLKICDATNLEEISTIEFPARILTAVTIGKTRLIDNCQLG